jgi:flagellar biosynthesis/type III secretory pathway M-ring protein FliF/YscJ
VPIGDPVTVEVTVRAEWESVGIVVIAVLVTALVAMGVVRTVLRLRRRGRPQNDTADDTIAGDDAGAKERADG